MAVRQNKNRLRRIAKSIESGAPLSPEDKLFISTSFRRIADGADPKEALGIKAKRGERTGIASDVADINKRLAMGWLAAARTPIEQGGLGFKSLEEARAKISELGLHAFGLNDSVLKKYWNENSEMRDANMHLSDEEIEDWKKCKWSN